MSSSDRWFLTSRENPRRQIRSNTSFEIRNWNMISVTSYLRSHQRQQAINESGFVRFESISYTLCFSNHSPAARNFVLSPIKERERGMGKKLSPSTFKFYSSEVSEFTIFFYGGKSSTWNLLILVSVDFRRWKRIGWRKWWDSSNITQC